MAQRFEDLLAWQRARRFSVAIYSISASGSFGRDFGLRDQIRRAAVSIMSNIAEGFERRSPREFAHFLSIARGSCAEVRSQLYVALDSTYIDNETFEILLTQAEELSRILNGLQRTVKNSA